MDSLHLTDRAVIALEGGEAREFLQGLITNDIAQLAPGSVVTEGDGALLLDCAADRAEALLKRLTMYRLRAKVGIALRPQLSVYVGLSGRPAERAITFTDPRLAALGLRSIGAVAEMPDFLEGPATYHAERLRLGVPESSDFGSDRIFALDAGLDELHGVSFTKGCYVGQELTARMKHRGTARKRILALQAENALPAPGTPVMSETAEIGEILSVYGLAGFATASVKQKRH